MKLSTALAVLIAIQRHGHRMHASADDHERKLLINQADAAKRVNDAVELAMASVDAGDVHGVALPLNYVHLSENYGNSQLLTVALRLPGVDMDQHVLVDTGSSSLAFCNKSLAEEAVNITKRDWAQCNAYGDEKTCPDDHSAKGASTFYVGQGFLGNIAAYNTGTGEEIASMDGVDFFIMSKQQMGFCNGPLDGIIGVAYSYLNRVVVIPSPEFDVMNFWNQSCESDGESIGACPAYYFGSVQSPLEHSLHGGVDSGYNSIEAFGLYCDYAATFDSEKDRIIPSLGAYFGGDVALNNTFYNSGTPQVASVFSCDGEYVVPSEGMSEWYLLNLHSITIPGLNNTHISGFDQCKECSHYARCFTDSGRNHIQLPIEESYCDELSSADPDTLGKMGPLLLDLEGVNGSTVTLSLPLLWLKKQKFLGNFECTGTSGRFILGLAIYQYYYLVYDMGNSTITFVNLQLQLSNETEAFIDGPELGGVNEPSTSSEPSTGSRHTGSPSTNTFVMAGLLLLAWWKYIF